MANLFDEAAEHLTDHSKGYGVKSLGLLSRAVTHLLSKQGVLPGATSTPQIRACFDSRKHMQPNIDNFKSMVRLVNPPARLHIPLGLAGNHMTALVVDIDAHGKSDILFFNSLGASNKGHYYELAKIFIDAVREKFPAKNDFYTSKRFQNLATGDNFCGDWSMWFLTICANKQNMSLEKLRDHFDTLSPNVTPQKMRSLHIQLLKNYSIIHKNSLIAASVATPVVTTLANPIVTPVAKPAIPPVTKAVVTESENPIAHEPAPEDMKAKKEKLLREKFTKIDQVLLDLKNNIGEIDQHKWPKALFEAKELLSNLQVARDSYMENLLKDPTNPALGTVFKNACKKAIDKAMPILEKDLKWKDYLNNMFKTLCSLIITIGFKSNLFTRVEAKSALDVEKAVIDLDLNSTMSPKS